MNREQIAQYWSDRDRLVAVIRHNQIANMLGVPTDCQTVLDTPMSGGDPHLVDIESKCAECGLPLYRHLCKMEVG